MRLSTQQFYQQGISALGDLSARTKNTQQQISSGERLLSAADDPVAATRIQQLESQLSVSAQFRQNIDLAENRLVQSEQVIDSIETIILRTRELVVQAGNGALTNAERQFLAIEIETRLEELEGLVNSRDAEGNFIFSGFKVETQPYTQRNGAYHYNGDDGQQLLQLAEDIFIPVSIPGNEVFGKIPVLNADISVSVPPGNNGTFALASAEVTDQTLYDASVAADYVVTFNDPASVVPPATNYTISRLEDGAALASNVLYDPVAGIQFNGVTLQGIGSPVEGDRVLLEAVSSRDMLTTVARIAREMPNRPASDRQAFVDEALIDLDAIQDSLLSARAQVGARLNTVETTRETTLDRELGYQDVLSEIRDLDYAEAISNLSFLTFNLEAAQQSFARVANLSLFNFLR